MRFLDALRGLGRALGMGGQREDVIETAAPTKAKGSKGKPPAVDVEAGADSAAQSIRIHESNGEVHFHVDKESLKCAVPVPEWAKAWQRLSRAARQGTPEAFDYIDYANKTILISKVLIKEDLGAAHSYSVHAELKVRPLSGTNNIFDQLKKFSEARG